MKLNLDKVEIIIQKGLLTELNKVIRVHASNPKLFIITDQNLDRLYRQTLIDQLKDFNLEFVLIYPGEEAKSLSGYQSVIEQLVEKKFRRDHLLVAFGGGVVTDLTGFVASTLYRGVKYVSIPTSLIGMVDASIGGKTALNTKHGKNLIGTFYQPKAIYIDPNFLETLSEFEYQNGLAEVIKAGLLGNYQIIKYLKENQTLDFDHLVRAIIVKVNIVKNDLLERNQRFTLNFGHTLGHAIEKYHEYQKYHHGSAISYGMLFALEYGIKAGLTDPVIYDEVKALLRKFELVGDEKLDYQPYFDLMRSDKKNFSDHIKFIVLKKYETPMILKLKLEELLI